MNFKWESYIQLAEELIVYQKNSSILEACYRSAISRCYYGVFCIARNFLISQGVAIPQVNTHKFIREKYQSSPDLLMKKIAKELRRLWLERKDADYEDKIKIEIKRAKYAIDLSKKILENLKKIGAL